MKAPELDLFEKLKSIGGVKPTASTEGSAIEKEMKKEDKDFGAPISLRTLFTHFDAHPMVLDFALLKAFGVQWYEWEASTIWAEVQRLFQTQISEHTRAKIQTVKTIHVADSPWVSWQVFEKIMQGLNGNIPRWTLMQSPSLNQLYAGVDILNEIRMEEFSNEVRLYAAAAILHEDVFYTPPPLDVFQAEVTQPYYHCRDCGNEDSALFHDGICDTCSEKFDAEQGLSMRPKTELLEKGIGKNVKLVLKYDPTEVEMRWKQVEHLPSEKVKLADTATDIQVGKLLEARDYMNIKRKQLTEQLTALKSWLGTS